MKKNFSPFDKINLKVDIKTLTKTKLLKKAPIYLSLHQPFSLSDDDYDNLEENKNIKLIKLLRHVSSTQQLPRTLPRGREGKFQYQFSPKQNQRSQLNKPHSNPPCKNPTEVGRNVDEIKEENINNNENKLPLKKKQSIKKSQTYEVEKIDSLEIKETCHLKGIIFAYFENQSYENKQTITPPLIKIRQHSFEERTCSFSYLTYLKSNFQRSEQFKREANLEVIECIEMIKYILSSFKDDISPQTVITVKELANIMISFLETCTFELKNGVCKSLLDKLIECEKVFKRYNCISSQRLINDSLDIENNSPVKNLIGSSNLIQQSQLSTKSENITSNNSVSIHQKSKFYMEDSYFNQNQEDIKSSIKMQSSYNEQFATKRKSQIEQLKTLSFVMVKKASNGFTYQTQIKKMFTIMRFILMKVGFLLHYQKMQNYFFREESVIKLNQYQQQRHRQLQHKSSLDPIYFQNDQDYQDSYSINSPNSSLSQGSKSFLFSFFQKSLSLFGKGVNSIQSSSQSTYSQEQSSNSWSGGQQKQMKEEIFNVAALYQKVNEDNDIFQVNTHVKLLNQYSFLSIGKVRMLEEEKLLISLKGKQLFFEIKSKLLDGEEVLIRKRQFLLLKFLNWKIKRWEINFKRHATENKKVNLFVSQYNEKQICRICDQKVRMKHFKQHSQLCKQISDIKQKLKNNMTIINQDMFYFIQKQRSLSLKFSLLQKKIDKITKLSEKQSPALSITSLSSSTLCKHQNKQNSLPEIKNFESKKQNHVKQLQGKEKNQNDSQLIQTKNSATPFQHKIIEELNENNNNAKSNTQILENSPPTSDQQIPEQYQGKGISQVSDSIHKRDNSKKRNECLLIINEQIEGEEEEYSRPLIPSDEEILQENDFILSEQLLKKASYKKQSSITSMISSSDKEEKDSNDDIQYCPSTPNLNLHCLKDEQRASYTENHSKKSQNSVIEEMQSSVKLNQNELDLSNEYHDNEASLRSSKISQSSENGVQKGDQCKLKVLMSPFNMKDSLEEFSKQYEIEQYQKQFKGKGENKNSKERKQTNKPTSIFSHLHENQNQEREEQQKQPIQKQGLGAPPQLQTRQSKKENGLKQIEDGEGEEVIIIQKEKEEQQKLDEVAIPLAKSIFIMQESQKCQFPSLYPSISETTSSTIAKQEQSFSCSSHTKNLSSLQNYYLSIDAIKENNYIKGKQLDGSFLFQQSVLDQSINTADMMSYPHIQSPLKSQQYQANAVRMNLISLETTNENKHITKSLQNEPFQQKSPKKNGNCFDFEYTEDQHAEDSINNKKEISLTNSNKAPLNVSKNNLNMQITSSPSSEQSTPDKSSFNSLTYTTFNSGIFKENKSKKLKKYQQIFSPNQNRSINPLKGNSNNQNAKKIQEVKQLSNDFELKVKQHQLKSNSICLRITSIIQYLSKMFLLQDFYDNQTRKRLILNDNKHKIQFLLQKSMIPKDFASKITNILEVFTTRISLLETQQTVERQLKKYNNNNENDDNQQSNNSPSVDLIPKTPFLRTQFKYGSLIHSENKNNNDNNSSNQNQNEDIVTENNKSEFLTEAKCLDKNDENNLEENKLNFEERVQEDQLEQSITVLSKSNSFQRSRKLNVQVGNLAVNIKNELSKQENFCHNKKQKTSNDKFDKIMRQAMQKQEDQFMENDQLTCTFHNGYYSDGALQNHTSPSQSQLSIQEKKISEDFTKIDDFEFLKLISKGAFGRVWLVKKKNTNNFYAMKIVNLAEKINKNNLTNLQNERDIFEIVQGDFVVKAVYTFSYESYLCFVMEYMIGGDLGGIMQSSGALDQGVAKFYIAEIILACNSLHKAGIVHRDLKPDNLLLSSKGHLKLTDFGLSDMGVKSRNMEKGDKEKKIRQEYNNLKKGMGRIGNMMGGEKINSMLSSQSKSDATQQLRQMKDNLDIMLSSKQIVTKKKTNKLKKYRIVGTPDYIPPEVIKGSSNLNSPSLDWWSVGVILFEMLIGIPPFNDETVEQIFDNIQSMKVPWDQIPIGYGEDEVSPEAEDLIKRLMDPNPATRLGVNGVQEIQQHPFFKDFDWANVRKMTPPVIPKVKNILDTSNFEKQIVYAEKEKVDPFFGLSKGQDEVNKAKDMLKGYNFQMKRYDILYEENCQQLEEIEKKMKFMEEEIIKDEEELEKLEVEYGTDNDDCQEQQPFNIPKSVITFPDIEQSLISLSNSNTTNSSMFLHSSCLRLQTQTDCNDEPSLAHIPEIKLNHYHSPNLSDVNKNDSDNREESSAEIGEQSQK